MFAFQLLRYMKKTVDTIIRLCIFVVIFIVMQIVASILTASIPFGDEVGLQRLTTYVISMLLTFGALRVYDRVSAPKPMPIMVSRRGFNPVIALWGVIVLVALSIVLNPLERFIPADERIFDDSVWTLVNIVVVAPIFEEILFRGKLYNMLCVNVSSLWSAVLSSLIFAAIHFEPIVLISGFISGMLFSYAYVRTRSIIAPIILHMCNNALAYALTILSYNEKSLLELVDSEAYFLIIYVVSAVIVSVAMVGVVVRLVRVRRQEPTA